MNKFLIAVSLVALALPANAASNKNFGKADDYGSERFAQVNRCMVKLIAEHKTPDPNGIGLSGCMSNNNYTFLPNARVFGNSGAKCKDSEWGVWKSWCWAYGASVE
jgi:hypothetical protein